MLLVYIFPISKLTERMVSEKESRARESMRMMGMTDFAYWASWFTYYTVQVTIITIIGLAMLKWSVFPASDGFLIFLFFWVYGMSQFGFCVFVQAFFSKARSASTFASMFYYGTSFIQQAV